LSVTLFVCFSFLGLSFPSEASTIGRVAPAANESARLAAAWPNGEKLDFESLNLEVGSGLQQDTTRRRTGGGLSRRARALLKKGASVDTSQATLTPAQILEMIRSMPRDSSARLEQFLYVRRDLPMVDLMQHKTSPLFLPDPLQVRTQVVLDSTRYVYHFRRAVGDYDTRVPLDLSLEEYLSVHMQQTIRKNWEDLAQAYQLTSQKNKGLGELFGQVTNIEIPVPKNPLFSIFGPNVIRLSINGAVDIHGAFRNTKSDLFVNNPLAQSRSEPDFSQEVQVNVKGTIGDKLNIDADWNTQRQFEYENQLKVRYTGYADDIVQSVEAGNVSLATNSSFISSSAALFGIKTGLQFGPFKLTTVASQKKGQIRELTVSGGGRPTPFQIRATDYSRDHYFVDTSYIAWFDSCFLNIPPRVDANKEIRDIEVWVTRIGIEDPNERDVVAFMSVNKVQQTQDDLIARAEDYDAVPGELEVGRFIRLDPNTDYTFDKYAGYITLNRSLQPQQAIAVAYTVPDPTDPRKSADIGNFSSRDTSRALKLVMKLVRPANLGPQFKTAWRLMLKNMYPLGVRGIKKEGFELKVLYEIPGTEPQDNLRGTFNLLEVLGLDRYGESPGSPPDGKFDYAPTLTIDEARGELIFPRTEPFREGIRRYFLSKGATIAEADSFAFSEVYDTTFNGATNSQHNRFLITGTSTGSMAATYNIGFNVVEGSVKVLVNGTPAPPNAYTVDYISGQVNIRDQGLLVPGQNLQIQYEANDLFQLASKSLLGARGEMTLGKASALGFTIMNLNQQSLSDKVRLGEEPISNTIMGVDGGTTLDLDFLTRALNWLPGVQTNALSGLTFRGEGAYMKPDPNTRKSPISQDGGKGVAYIDDFEGARKLIPLGVNFGAWRQAAIPDYDASLDDPTKLTLSEKMEYEGRLTWYNVLPSDVTPTDLRPNKSIVPEENQVTVLNLYFKPRERGMYNYSMNLDTKLRAHPDQAWAGVQTLIGSISTNLLDENINFIEIWVRLDKVQPTMKLNVDLGILSEVVIPTPPVNGMKIHTEDGLDGSIINGILRPGEDLGIDGRSDADEKKEFADFINKYPEYGSDPSGDDWIRPGLGSLNPEDYNGVNGTEGNGQSDAGRFPDTEDLNRNNVQDRINSYYEYELPLDTNSTAFRQYVTGGANDWYQIRIPLNEYTRKVGDPSLSTVEGIRVWMTGATESALVRIAELNLIGNQWQELVKNDSSFRASVINREDNPEYTSPPGLPLLTDPTRPDLNIKLNEQSLDLVINGLKDGESRQALKLFTVRPLDLFSYRAMKMFVHGDEKPGSRLRFRDTTDYDLEIFLRFGSDSLNYYEYREPIRPGWDPMNDVNINFGQITALKLGRDSVQGFSARVPVPGGPPGATFQVRGNPTLTNVRLIIIGIENPLNKGSTVVNGEVWVDELRLTDVDDTPGWAYRFDTSLKLADIGNIAVNMTQRDPNFHALEDHFGTRNTDRNWGLSASLAFERFLPQSWAGTTLAFSYSHLEQVQNPKYMPGTDILVAEAAQRTADVAQTDGASPEEVKQVADSVRLRSQTVNVTDTYALPSIRFNIPSSSWLVTETVNKLSFAYSYTTTSRRSPVTQTFSQWQWNARGAYALQFGQKNYVSPFALIGDFFLFQPWKDLKLFYSPRNFNVSTTFARAQTFEQARDQTAPKPIVRNFASSRSMSFSWQFTDGGLLNLATDYSVDIQSSLLNFEVDSLGHQRPFSAILGDMFGKAKLIDFGTDLSYGQSINFNPRLTVPPILKLDKFVSATTRYSARYDWTNNPQAGSLGKSAANSGNLSMTFDLNLRAIGDEIWSPPRPAAAPPPGDTTKGSEGLDFWGGLDRLSRVLFKTPIFDFEKFNISFSQQNRSQNSGVVGRAGFANVFGRVPFFQSSLPENGPSLMYQLGLSSDPSGDVIVKSKGGFPFLTGYTLPGPRAPNGNLVDMYGQKNTIAMRTSRPLWEGASLEFNWNVGWSYNVNRTLQSDSLGVAHEISSVISGDVDRSFLSFPQVLFFKFFRTSIQDVQNLYGSFRADPTDTRPDDAKLADAFENGLEALPFARKLLGDILPRVNWTFHWDGLEKLPLLSSIASKVSLEHSYQSDYKRRWKISPDGNEVTEAQQVTYGFSPLVGLTFAFKGMSKGSFGATFRVGTSTDYDLVPAAKNIVESGSTDISVTANYSRQGFQFPFFGLLLSNDIDIRLSYSYSKTSRRVYDMSASVFKPDGTPMEGMSRTNIEPRIQYILSARVTASVYYKYSKVKPDAGGSRIPGSTTNEMGVDVRVSIQP
jgi:cell surface protein SprA